MPIKPIPCPAVYTVEDGLGGRLWAMKLTDIPQAVSEKMLRARANRSIDGYLVFASDFALCNILRGGEPSADGVQLGLPAGHADPPVATEPSKRKRTGPSATSAPSAPDAPKP